MLRVCTKYLVNKLSKLNISCPICNSKNLSYIRSYSSLDAASHIKRDAKRNELKKISDYIAENVWGQRKCDFMRCSICGFKFANPFVAGDSYLYNILYDKSNISSFFWKWDFDYAFNFIKKRLETGSKFLDVGAGPGHFISKIANDVTMPEFCYVVEYSDICRKEISKLKINAFSEILMISNKKEFFDCVSMFQVIEHMDDLYPQLKIIDTITKKSGLIIISVPNDLQRDFYDRCKIYEDIPPTHLSRFNYKSFNLIAKKMNWDILKHSRHPAKSLEKFKRFLSIGMRNNLKFQRIKESYMHFPKVVKKLLNGLYILKFCLQNSVKILQLLLNKNLGTTQIVIFRKSK